MEHEILLEIDDFHLHLYQLPSPILGVRCINTRGMHGYPSARLCPIHFTWTIDSEQLTMQPSEAVRQLTHCKPQKDHEYN